MGEKSSLHWMDGCTDYVQRRVRLAPYLVTIYSILLQSRKLALQLKKSLVEVLIRSSRLTRGCRPSVIGCAEGLRGSYLRREAALTRRHGG